MYTQIYTMPYVRHNSKENHEPWWWAYIAPGGWPVICSAWSVQQSPSHWECFPGTLVCFVFRTVSHAWLYVMWLPHKTGSSCDNRFWHKSSGSPLLILLLQATIVLWMKLSLVYPRFVYQMGSCSNLCQWAQTSQHLQFGTAKEMWSFISEAVI